MFIALKGKAKNNFLTQEGDLLGQGNQPWKTGWGHNVPPRAHHPC